MNEITEYKKQSISAYLSSDKVKQSIVNVIGTKDLQSFVSSVVSAVQVNPDLAKCTNQSIFTAALLGYSLKLPPSPQLGFFYMIPYKNTAKSKTAGTEIFEAQFQISYKGLYQLAMRSGQYRKILATEVHEGELLDYNPLTEEIVFSKITNYAKRSSKPVIGFYAAFELTNGANKFVYWPREQMEKHAHTYSASYRSDEKWKSCKSFWSKDFNQMGIKTVLKQLLTKWGIMTVEMSQFVEADQAVINEDGTKNYIENVPAEPTPAIDVEADVEMDSDAEVETKAEEVEEN